MATAPWESVTPDLYALNREVDKTKVRTFLGKNAAFFGPLMCNLLFAWNDQIATAQVDGITLEWSPKFFAWLKPAPRETVMRHEMEHVARLHMLRRGSRDPELWGQACDHRINLDLRAEGYSFEDIEWALMDPRFGQQAEEEIYEILKAEAAAGTKKKQKDWLAGDIKSPPEGAKHQAVANVVRAIQQAKAAGKPGDIPGNVQLTVEAFLAPVLDPRILLQRFFTELGDLHYTWKRPNRRFQDIYMPALEPDMDRLAHLMYFLDISGSVSDGEIRRFNSEIKQVKDLFNPRRLTIVTFDTEIHDVIEVTEDDHFDRITVTGRGGTSLKPVRQYIIDQQPTAALIFTDLGCRPMKSLPKEIPILWIVTGNPGATVPFGQLIHLPAEKQ